MTDQDPPIEPLKRLDPTEPDEQGLGRLERLDPEAEEAGEVASASGAIEGAPKNGSRLRNGLTAAVTLATLLSLSSIAAIGGLVAISMRSVDPDGIGAVAPVEAGAPLATIRVGESAQGAAEPERDPSPPPGDADDSVVEFTPVDPPPAVGDGTLGGNGGDEGQGGQGSGSGGGSKGAGGAWCDARAGSACDATAGGSVLVPGTPEGEGYVGDEDDELPEEDEDYDDEGTSTGSSGSSGSSSGSHRGKHH